MRPCRLSIPTASSTISSLVAQREARAPRWPFCATSPAWPPPRSIDGVSATPSPSRRATARRGLRLLSGRRHRPGRHALRALRTGIRIVAYGCFRTYGRPRRGQTGLPNRFFIESLHAVPRPSCLLGAPPEDLALARAMYEELRQQPDGLYQHIRREALQILGAVDAWDERYEDCLRLVVMQALSQGMVRDGVNSRLSVALYSDPAKGKRIFSQVAELLALVSTMVQPSNVSVARHGRHRGAGQGPGLDRQGRRHAQLRRRLLHHRRPAQRPLQCAPEAPARAADGRPWRTARSAASRRPARSFAANTAILINANPSPSSTARRRSVGLSARLDNLCLKLDLLTRLDCPVMVDCQSDPAYAARALCQANKEQVPERGAGAARREGQPALLAQAAHRRHPGRAPRGGPVAGHRADRPDGRRHGPHHPRRHRPAVRPGSGRGGRRHLPPAQRQHRPQADRGLGAPGRAGGGERGRPVVGLDHAVVQAGVHQVAVRQRDHAPPAAGPAGGRGAGRRRGAGALRAAARAIWRAGARKHLHPGPPARLRGARPAPGAGTSGASSRTWDATPSPPRRSTRSSCCGRRRRRRRRRRRACRPYPPSATSWSPSPRWSRGTASRGTRTASPRAGGGGGRGALDQAAGQRRDRADSGQNPDRRRAGRRHAPGGRLPDLGALVRAGGSLRGLGVQPGLADHGAVGDGGRPGDAGQGGPVAVHRCRPARHEACTSR